MMQSPNGTGPMPTRLRKTALVLLLFAGLSLVIPLLALAFTSLVLDAFPPRAPPM
jgi:hypothetical protein